MKKSYPRKNASIKNILTGIREGRYYVDALTNFDTYKPVKGFERMTVGIVAAPFDIDVRYFIQKVNIPTSQRGNLRKYAGKKVQVICTTIDSRSPRINFLIKEA